MPRSGAAASRACALLRRVGRNGLTQTRLVAMLASEALSSPLMDPAGHSMKSLLTGDAGSPVAGEAIVVATRERAAAARCAGSCARCCPPLTRRVLATDIGDPTSGFS